MAKRPVHRFSADNQPATQGRKKRERVAHDGVFNRAKISALAEKGVEAADIAITMGIAGKIAGDQALRANFEELVALGHSQHRVALAKVARAEADKGKSNALRDLLKGWLPRYTEELTDEDEQGIVERGLEMLKQLTARRAENDAATKAV